MADIIIIAILAVITLLIIRSVFKQKVRGNCPSCENHTSCHGHCPGCHSNTRHSHKK